MSGVFAVIKALFVPALIAGALYLILAYVVIPMFRKHRNRYSQYLPLDSLSQHTSSFRERIGRRLTTLMLPSSMRWRREIVDARMGSGNGEDELAFGDEEGESMVGFDVNRRDREVRGGRVPTEMDSERRLSRDLEEGFKDDSDEDNGDDRRR